MTCERCRGALWVCEAHHDQPWPHGDCPGPGEPAPREIRRIHQESRAGGPVSRVSTRRTRARSNSVPSCITRRNRRRGNHSPANCSSSAIFGVAS